MAGEGGVMMWPMWKVLERSASTKRLRMWTHMVWNLRASYRSCGYLDDSPSFLWMLVVSLEVGEVSVGVCGGGSGGNTSCLGGNIIQDDCDRVDGVLSRNVWCECH